MTIIMNKLFPEWYSWFQNLKREDKEKRWFNFRGSFGPRYDNIWCEYQLASGFECKLKVKIYPYNRISLTIGFFFGTLWLTIPFFSFRRWISQSKETGFYFHNWALVWSWMSNEWGEGRSNKDPWWKHFYFHIDDFFLGRAESLKDELTSNHDVYFMMGDKEFKMDSIQWIRYRRFRRFIPYSLYHRTSYCVDMKIEKPPGFAGKGENDWDCGDDATYGMHAHWPYAEPTWKNRNDCTVLAIDMYVDNVFKNIKRYGTADGDNRVTKDSVYKYVGNKNTDCQAEVMQ